MCVCVAMATPMAALVALWQAHSGSINEVGFVHDQPQPQVLDHGTKLAVPYHLLTAVAAEAQAQLLRANADANANAALALLTVNGNNHEAWNVRKRALQQADGAADDGAADDGAADDGAADDGAADGPSAAAIHRELAITGALLVKHPKSACGWAHRYAGGQGQRQSVVDGDGTRLDVMRRDAADRQAMAADALGRPGPDPPARGMGALRGCRRAVPEELLRLDASPVALACAAGPPGLRTCGSKRS